MRKALLCIFALFVCIGIFAQQQPVVAVAPFDAISGISATDANMITRVFFIRLGNTNRVSLVDRNVVDRVLREHSFQTGDWSNEQKTAELGRALNSDWIVRGELEKFGENILVTVQFYDIQTFRFMGGADTLLANANEAMEKMDPLVNRLVQTIASAGERTPRQQGGNAGASAYYGTWLNPRASNSLGFDQTISIEADRITIRNTNGGSNYGVLINLTWTPERNNNINTLTDYPNGFKISGMLTDSQGMYVGRNLIPIYIFIHRTDSRKILVYKTPDSPSELPDVTGWGPFAKIN